MIPKHDVSRLALLSFAFVFILPFKAMLIRIQTGYLDSAGFLDLIATNEPLKSQYFSSGHQVGGLLRAPLETLCNLVYLSPLTDESFFLYHPYLLSIPIGMFHKIFGLSPAVLGTLAILGSFAVGVGLLTDYMRKRGVSVFATVLVLTLVLICPNISQSLLGQPYFDRILFGPAVAGTLTLEKLKNGRPANHIFFATTLLVLALISERGALLAGLIGGFGAILCRPDIRTWRTQWISFGAAVSAVAHYWYWQSISQYESYNVVSLASFQGRLADLQNDYFFPKLIVFVGTLAPLLLISLCAGRLMLLSVLAITPNVFISVGGAELEGFSTHYHQVYSPILTTTAVIGLTRLMGGKRINLEISRHAKRKQLPIVLLVLGATLGFWALIPGGARPSQVAKSAVLAYYPYFTSDYKFLKILDSDLRVVVSQLQEFSPHSVAMPENVMPRAQLSGLKNPSYWPTNLGNVDMVLAPRQGGKFVPMPIVDFRNITPYIDECISDLLLTQFVERKSIEIVTGSELVILTRKQER